MSGRSRDHIERGNIDLSTLKVRILDEADEMLRMGFVDDVELILGKVKDLSKFQTLLFSATLLSWVKGISSRFLKPDKKTVDLVGNEKMKASTNVSVFGGYTFIFTEAKEAASGLAEALPGARALHGGIQEGQREVTLAGFRSGKYMTLVATNVAARGLDTNDVQLIIQCEPPLDVEDYIHRSGRTGRAGYSGVAFMLYDPRSVIPAFKSVAEELLNTSGLSAVDLLSKALAKAAGYTEIKKRSLLSSMENHVTVLLEAGKPIYSPS
ncbi:hypothetical protein DVH24_024636 [Malus domestica]|uniref:RNA helicase n=1 Tax=Malus domestica TaxID=3750 RepID=A0A498JMY6_MALDO|nr:hypothetical protein DVH24_024636 [Malus domestica]